MKTIKDVASLAGVSVGSVSNVINGKTNNQELIEKVEKAMAALDYRPDAGARSLKNTKSNIIGVIIPNLTRPDFINILSNIEKEANINGYHILLKVCQNNPYIEKRAINQFLMQRVDGIIVVNSISQKKPGAILYKDILPVVFLDLNKFNRTLCNEISIDYNKAFEIAMKESYDSGIKQIGIIMERGYIAKETVYEIYLKYFTTIDNIKFVDYSQERGFKAAYELLYKNPKLELFITSNHLLAKGAKQAAKVLNRSEIEHITFKEENWIEDQSEYIGIIGIPYKKIVHKAFENLLDSIEKPNLSDYNSINISASYRTVEDFSLKLNHITKKSSRITLYLVESPAAHALSMLAKVYEKATGTLVECNILKYEDLYKKLHLTFKSKDSNIDGMMMDVYWITSLIETNGLENLAPYFNGKEEYFQYFLEELLTYYGVEKEHIYGLPFMSGTQLLFYQRDLFEEPTLKTLYRRKYGLELVPPTTWPEVNLIAEFFTKSLNPKSPVKYGFANVQGANINTTISFLNRLWAYGGDVFQDDRITINSNNGLSALKNFKKSYQYCSLDQVGTTWDHVVENFKTGDYASVILYDSYAIDISDYTSSKVAGNIGASILPGGTSVLGGWSLGINKYSKNKENTMKFIEWISSNACAVPYSLLGGITLHTNYYKRNDLKHIYPWIELLPESYRLARKRKVPKQYLKNNKYIQVYEHIIGEELQLVLDNKKGEAQGLADMEKRILEL